MENLKEYKESIARRNNIIIFKAAESENPEIRKQEDKRIVQELCEVTKTDVRSVKNVTRLGKKSHTKNDPRPMRVIFEDEKSKGNFISNLRCLEKERKHLRNLSVVHDMTQKERQTNKEKWEEAKAKNLEAVQIHGKRPTMGQEGHQSKERVDLSTGNHVHSFTNEGEVFNGLHCLYTNADSLPNKLEELKVKLQNSERLYDLVAITEVYPKHYRQKPELQLKGYNMLINDSALNTRGVAIYAKEELPVEEVKIDDDFQNCVWCKIKLHGGDTLLTGCVYKSPSSSEDNLKNLKKKNAKDGITQEGLLSSAYYGGFQLSKNRLDFMDNYW
jgi:hypothetical protein